MGGCGFFFLLSPFFLATGSDLQCSQPFVEKGPSHLCESCFCCERVGSSKQDWDLSHRKLLLHPTLTGNQKKFL